MKLLFQHFMLLILLGQGLWGQAGSSTPRNGSGINPLCLQSSNVPSIGQVWSTAIDTSAFPNASLALLQARALPSMGIFTALGEVLFDPSSSQLFVRTGVPVAGVASIAIPIPNNLSLVGLPFTIQAGVRSGESLSALCNALDAVIGGLPPSVPNFSSSLSSGAAPLRVRFTDKSSNSPISWLWDFGDGGVSTLQNPNYIYRSAGTYTVSLKVTDATRSSMITKVDLVSITGMAPRNNVIVLLADDLSASDLALYGLDPNLPPGLTPNIDALASRGLVFERAWANPLCSPTRALLLTGRYGFRTGFGNNVLSSSLSLRQAELTLPEALEVYGDTGLSHAAFGKWHLASMDSPIACSVTSNHGFDLFEGTEQEVSQYCTWTLESCPADTLTPSAIYQPEFLFDAAASWIAAQSGSWFTYLAPQSPYEQLHIPPNQLQSLLVGADCASCPEGLERSCYLAAVQAFDTKLGDLIASLGSNWESETTIVFAGDNGTPMTVLDYSAPGHGKGSLFEGGLHVPLIIAGKALDPSLRGTRTDDLVSLVDIYATVGALIGTTSLPSFAGEDSVDLTPLLQVPQASAGRTSLFAEKFNVNGLQRPYPGHRAALRDSQFKIIYSCEADSVTDFYDLFADPLELNNLILSAPPQPGTPEGEALLSLEAELLALMDC